MMYKQKKKTLSLKINISYKIHIRQSNNLHRLTGMVIIIFHSRQISCHTYMNDDCAVAPATIACFKFGSIAL